MRTISAILFIFVSVTILSGCEEDIDLCIERKPIPVIYSILNKYDTVPYSTEIPEFFIYGGTIGTNRVVNLNLDYLTREAVANDTTLRPFRFVRW